MCVNWRTYSNTAAILSDGQVIRPEDLPRSINRDIAAAVRFTRHPLLRRRSP
jgi:hypothetical protein